MKTTSLYVQFLLINVVKFNMFLNTAKCNPPCAGIVFLLAKMLHCNSVTSLFLYNLNAAGRTSQFVGALAVQVCSDSKHSYKM